MNPLEAKIKVLIADDEPNARARINSLLSEESDIELIDESRDGRETINALRNNKYDLCFLDIQMPYADGFEALRAIDIETAPVIVFVTAYDQFAIQAFEISATDYLLKPFGKPRFIASLDRARKQIDLRRRGQLTKQHTELLETVDPERTDLERIAVRTAGRIHFLSIKDVDWIDSSGNYVALHFDAKVHLVRDSLDNFHSRLDTKQFIRTHKSTIVNISRKSQIIPGIGSEYQITLSGGQTVPLSRRRFREVKELISE